MGEYATSPDGTQRIKLGTCEDLMYVTRADLEALRAAGWRADGPDPDLGQYLHHRAFRVALPNTDTPGDPATIDAREPDYPNRVRIRLPAELAAAVGAVEHSRVYPSLAPARVSGKVDPIYHARYSMPCPFSVEGAKALHGSPPSLAIDLIAEGLGDKPRAVFECPFCRDKFNLLDEPHHADVARAFRAQFSRHPDYNRLRAIVEAGLPAEAVV